MSLMDHAISICDMFYKRCIYFYNENYKCRVDFFNLTFGVT